jgi:hypothetical protein
MLLPNLARPAGNRWLLRRVTQLLPWASSSGTTPNSPCQIARHVGKLRGCLGAGVVRVLF